MEHTKGPWNVQLAQPYDEHEFEVSYDTEDSLTYPIADVRGKLESGDAEANANLIASAPDLYEALKSLACVCRDVSYTHSELNKARQALAKAEGK